MALTAQTAPLPVLILRRAGTDGWLMATLVLVSVVGTVFNDLAPLLPIGELSKDAFVYLFPLLAFGVFRQPGEVEVPVLLAVFFALFVLVCIAGVASNYDAISRAWFKGRTGTGRIFTQALSIGFGFGVALIFFNLCRRGFLPVIARGAWWALLVMFGVGIIEFLSWYSVPGPTQLYSALSKVIHVETSEFYPLRLRTTAFEVSWAAVMLTFVFPFALLHTRASLKRTALAFLAVFFLVTLAQSRTAMLVIGCQSLLIATLRLSRRTDVAVYLGLTIVVALLAVMLMPRAQEAVTERLSNLIEYGSMGGSVDKDSRDENVSNITRLAAIRAGAEMFRDRPLLGVGLGQYGFSYVGYIRAEDMRSWEVRSYVTDADREYGWPPTYSIHIRLLAETGLLGYVVWMGVVLFLFARSLSQCTRRDLIGRAHLAVALTTAGWLLLGFSIDSFRFFGGWIAIGIAMALPLAASQSRSATPGTLNN